MLCNGSIRFSAAIPVNSVGAKSPEILANYVEEIFEVIKSGHSALIPTLMELYQYDDEEFIKNYKFLIELLATDINNRSLILPILHNISKKIPELFFDHIEKFESSLSLPTTASQTVMILSEIAKKEPEILYPLVPSMIDVVEFDNNLLFMLPGILGRIGITSKKRAEEIITYLDNFLELANENQVSLIKNEINNITDIYSELLERKIDKIDEFDEFDD
jgi:hypothetical protein